MHHDIFKARLEFYEKSGRKIWCEWLLEISGISSLLESFIEKTLN